MRGFARVWYITVATRHHIRPDEKNDMASPAKEDDVDQPSIETLLIHADRHLNPTSTVAPPIYQTATFRADSAADFSRRAAVPRHPEFYSRYGNPTLNQVEGVLASLERAESALVTASGMAAITGAVLTFVENGAHVVAQKNHYGGTFNLLRELLPKFGIDVTLVDQRDPAEFHKAIRANTKVFLLESPSNPVMSLTDLQAVATVAKEHGILSLIDNTFATPVNQRPLELGIDLVLYSGTKYFGGHSDLVAGAVVGSKALLEKVWNHHVILGGVLGPIDAWLLLRGLRTLALRVRQHNENALALAQFLGDHDAVRAVHYPGLKSHPQHALACRQMTGFGGMLSLDLKGGFDAAERLLNHLKLASCASSLGGVESLAVHPASNFLHYMSAQEAERIGILPGLVRVSVGLEAQSDLIADFEQALERC
jgi:cystathionine beta-lyase/cystathionine gamma-synthase